MAHADDLAAIIRSSHDAIYGKDRDGVITTWNIGAEQMYGYTAAEAVGQPVSILIPPHRRGEEKDILRRILDGERIEHYETERLRKDGSLIRVSLSISPIEDANEERVGASVIARDVTRRYDESSMFRALLESAPDAMVIAGTDGRIAIVNRQTEQIFGYDRDRLVGEHIEVLVPPRFRSRHAHHRAGFFLDPQVRPMGPELELYGVRSDGTEFPVEISLSPIATERGLLVAAAVRDVSERKGAEDRFRRFLEFAPDPIVILDGEQVIVEANSQVKQVFGYGREELVGRSIETLLPERFHGQRFTQPDGSAAAGELQRIGQATGLCGRRKDGSEFPVDISFAPLETHEGTLVSAAIRDVSERKRAEDHARRLEEMSARRRQALELNDEILQGLTVALWAQSLHRHEEAREAIERTMTAAQSIITQMLVEEKEDRPIEGGDLVRERKADVLRRSPEGA